MKNLNPSASSWNRFKNFIDVNYGKESGKMIVHVGVITWITATVSQVVAIMMNKEVPKEQKKFLIPQEIADGALNVLAFYLITNSMKNIAGKLASTGKWSTKAIRDFVKNHSDVKMGELTTNLGVRFKEDAQFHECYDGFKGGLDMIATAVGSVAACNVATPFIRNYWGAKRQKESIAKDKMQKNTVPAVGKLNKNNYFANNGLMKV